MLTHSLDLIDIVDATSKTVQELQRLSLPQEWTSRSNYQPELKANPGESGHSPRPSRRPARSRVKPAKAGPCFVAQVKTKEVGTTPSSSRSPRLPWCFPHAPPFDAHAGAAGRHHRRAPYGGRRLELHARPGAASRRLRGRERADVVGVSRAARGSRASCPAHGFSGLGASHGNWMHCFAGLDRARAQRPRGSSRGRRMAGEHGPLSTSKDRPGRPRTQPAPGQGRGPRSPMAGSSWSCRPQGTGDGREGCLMASIELRDAGQRWDATCPPTCSSPR